jgi:RNA polymerase II subunit A small phosphatase-like protein
MPDDRILLILDIDETLLYASERPLDRPADCLIGPYYVYFRPNLRSFVSGCTVRFRLAVWSSSSHDYVSAVTKAAFPPDVELEFIWERSRCVARFDAEWQETYYVKDLKKVKRLGFNLDRVLIVDDTPQKSERNYGNAIYVRPYAGEPDDRELIDLGQYLGSICEASNVRRLEKRGWRGRLGIK